MLAVVPHVDQRKTSVDLNLGTATSLDTRQAAGLLFSSHVRQNKIQNVLYSTRSLPQLGIVGFPFIIIISSITTAPTLLFGPFPQLAIARPAWECRKPHCRLRG